ncbi:MAG: FAD-dependent oxidoreductase, partial [Planctomycetota bacterium]|nr:FAD-dependent oxidoreductase [Planctomycetota bacterium]
MRRIKRFASRLCRTAFLALLLVPLAVGHADQGRHDSPEVVVYGATPAGIAAALNAAEGGRSVWLVEPTGRIGGMLTHGLSHSDFHSFEAINGPFLQFSERVLKYYRATYGEDAEQVKDSWRGTHGEPSVNLLIFRQMLAERPTITVLTNHRLVEVEVENATITTLHFVLPESKKVTVKPQLIIDATYEGDLLAAANVPYRVGREAKSEYSESLAPETADDQLQGYNFRLCMTQKESNRVPVPVPDNYNREDYAAIVPLVKAGQFDAAFGYPGQRFILKAHLPVMPNGKHDINDVSQGLIRLSLPGHNREYPDGDLAKRRLIEKKHLDWQLGLIHFVQTDPALPEPFRREAANWGLCRDEFTDTHHLP